MDTQQVLNLIKESFELWYNRKNATKASVVINYNDTQSLPIKAFHTITMDVQAVSIVNGQAQTESLIALKENYNHGLLTEDEAKLGLVRKMLVKMFDF